MKFAAGIAVSFITHFPILLVPFCIIYIYSCMFALFNFVNYVVLLLVMCSCFFVYVFLLLCLCILIVMYVLF